MNRKSTGWAVVRSALWGLTFLFCLALAVTIYASGPDGDGGTTVADAAQGNRLAGRRSDGLSVTQSAVGSTTLLAAGVISSTRIYLPNIVKMSAAATTSSALLARPPAAGQLGILAGLLAIGFLIGIALVFSPEPESLTSARSIDEQNENAPTKPPAQTG